MNSGVPQGSVLGPTFFSLYINDLPNIFKDTGAVCKLFADDVKLYCFPTSSETQVQSALVRVAQWSHIWQLQLAPEKCQVFSIAGRRKRKTNHDYSINGQTLQQVVRFGDLGIMMDPSLKFASHIDTLLYIIY